MGVLVAYMRIYGSLLHTLTACRLSRDGCPSFVYDCQLLKSGLSVSEAAHPDISKTEQSACVNNAAWVESAVVWLSVPRFG